MARLLVVTQHFWPENFRINDMVRGLIDDGVEVDVLCGLPNYPKGEWFAGYRYTGPRREEWNGARVFRAGEVRRKGNTSLRIFLNYVSWPFLALFNLWRLPGGYDGILCYNTSPVLMSFPALVYGKLHRVPVTNYVLDIWPENLYSVLPVKSRFWRRVADAVSDWHYRQADKLIAMSDGLRARLLARAGKAEQDVAVIPQYCEDFYAVPGPCEELRERFAGRFNLVFTGNFSPAQALPTVIRAAGRARAAGAEFCFVDGAVIVGTPFAGECDRLAVVTAPYEQSVARICRRDGISPEMARRRLDAQTPERTLLEAADYVIHNNGTLADLEQQCRTLLQALRKEAHEIPSTPLPGT